MNKKFPLISIIVVTYNSQRYVIDTLESIYCQSYDGPIELIISDDGSNDNTRSLCKEWIDEHGEFFSNVKMIQTPYNLGICGNYNFALNEVNGEWVKYIAGDDILMPNAIQRYVEESEKSGDSIIICGTLCINENNTVIGPRFLMEEHLQTPDPYIQARNMALAGHGIVEGPTFFIRTELLRQMGGMDLKYPMLEDFPFAFRCAISGYHIHVIKETLVKYRIYGDSVSHGNRDFHDMFYGALYDARMQISRKEGDYLFWWHAYIQKKILRPTKPFSFSSIRRYLYLLTDLWMHLHRIYALLKNKE